MYSRKSVGPRMDSLGIPALIGYSYEDFPSRTTPSRLLPRKDEIRPNIKLKFFRKSSMPNLSNALDISSGTVQVTPDL